MIRQAQHGQVENGLWHTGSRYVGCLNPREAGLLMPWATSVPSLPAPLRQGEVCPVSRVLLNDHQLSVGKDWKHTCRDGNRLMIGWGWGGSGGERCLRRRTIYIHAFVPCQFPRLGSCSMIMSVVTIWGNCMKGLCNQSNYFL